MRLLSGVADDTDQVIQCDADSPDEGRALGGGVAADRDTPGGVPEPTVELSAPANADGEKALAGDRATFTAYVVCAVRPPLG